MSVLLAISSVLLISAAHAATAAPERRSDPVKAAVVCGYNDNINGRAIWRNCDATWDFIRTTAWLGSTSYQCVPGNQDWDLGPTWFIVNSVLVGFCDPLTGAPRPAPVGSA